MTQIILIGSPKQLYSDKSLTAALEAAHSQHKGKVVFVTANLEEPLTENIVKYFGASNNSDTVQVSANMSTSECGRCWHVACGLKQRSSGQHLAAWRLPSDEAVVRLVWQQAPF